MVWEIAQIGIVLSSKGLKKIFLKDLLEPTDLKSEQLDFKWSGIIYIFFLFTLFSGYVSKFLLLSLPGGTSTLVLY